MTPEYRNADDWREWANYVRENIKELKTDMKEARADIVSIKSELSGIKVKMAFIGATAGALITLAVNVLIKILART
jgi:uncharacterized coiled-coil DUF342 family protein